MHKDIKNSIQQFKDNINQAFIVEHIEIKAPEWLEVDTETKRALNLAETIKIINNK